MRAEPEVGQTVLNFIGGRWEPAASDTWTDRYDPADGSVLVARAPDSTGQDARRAAEAAETARASWGNTPAPRRSRFLFEWLRWIDGRRGKLAELLTREEGKILAESKAEVQRAMDILEYTAGMGRRLGGRVLPSEEQGVFCYSTSQPLGVVGLITPWNFPVAIPVWKLAPSLVAGNTAVLKPSPLTPLTASFLVRGLEEVGIPSGVVNLIHGDSGPGVELTQNPSIKGISFTGSTKVGRSIAKSTAERLLKLQLELGGKNPQVVLEDADLGLAIDGVMAGAFGSTGQRCTATSRAIVVGRVYDEFLDRVVERAAALKVGPGIDPGVEMGPLVDAKALEGVTGYAAAARSEGGRFHTGGDRATEPRLARGNFFNATVVQANTEMEIATEEIFGPVLAVIKASDIEEAIGIANSVRYGLTASIYTRDVSRVFKFAERAEAGIVHVNRPGVGGYSHAPFGGIKESGYGGREVGDEVMNFYTETKTVYVNHK